MAWLMCGLVIYFCGVPSEKFVVWPSGKVCVLWPSGVCVLWPSGLCGVV